MCARVLPQKPSSYAPPPIERGLAQRWAGELCVRDNWVILDTETTGLGEDAQVIEVGMVNANGWTLFNRRCRPTVAIEAEAFDVHGISADMLRSEPTFATIRDALVNTIAGRRVIMYNADFDWRMLRQTCDAFDLPWVTLPTDDAMLWYARYVGQWDDRHMGYRWQKLPGGGHGALNDALATWRLIRKMGGYQAEVPDDAPF